MKQNRVILCAVLFVGLGLAKANAQESANAAGGDGFGSGGSISYSVGQAVYTTATGTKGLVASGVQQTYEISKLKGAGNREVSSVIDDLEISLNLSAFPNPTIDVLTLKIENYHNQNMVYRLIDLDGRLLKSELIKENNTNISMLGLASKIYLLQVLQDNQTINVFKIIKK